MPVARRQLLIAAAVAPASFVAGRAARAVDASVQAAVSGAARAARPTPDGNSATRCARCGALDHTMLDPRCRMALQLRSSRLASPPAPR